MEYEVWADSRSHCGDVSEISSQGSREPNQVKPNQKQWNEYNSVVLGLKYYCKLIAHNEYRSNCAFYQYVFSSTVYWANLGVAPPQKWLSEFQSCCCFLSTIFLEKERLFQAWSRGSGIQAWAIIFCVCVCAPNSYEMLKEYQNYDKKNLQSIGLSSHWFPTQG